MQIFPLHKGFGMGIFRFVYTPLKRLKMHENTPAIVPRDQWYHFFSEKFEFFNGFCEKISKRENYPILWSSMVATSKKRNIK